MRKALSGAIFVPLVLVGCDKSTQSVVVGRPTIKVLKEVTVVRLQPEGQAPLSTASLNGMLAKWTEVPYSEFYYESAPHGIGYAFQEGKLVDGDSEDGTWRFYHCAGLRLQSGEGPVRYFLPAPSTGNNAP